MVKIRLMRMGKRKEPYYRVVVADSRSPRDGRFIENLGRYHPRAHPSVIEIDEERALHWLRNGAQPSDPVRVLLQKTGIWSSFTGEPSPPPFDPSAEPSGSPDEATDEPSESTDEAEASAEGTSPVPEAEVEASTSEGTDAPTSDKESS
ncbi:MAG TPA: 30S ribosomal protein S16 [Actinomycetota bacterium]|nr:30S ribosomal protein S16 [Actinomycetota bacterium]